LKLTNKRQVLPNSKSEAYEKNTARAFIFNHLITTTFD